MIKVLYKKKRHAAISVPLYIIILVRLYNGVIHSFSI